MLSTSIITIKIQGVEREIFVSPLLLQSKVKPVMKLGVIEVLYFYEYLRDDDYEAMIEQEPMAEVLKSDAYIINYGQDFEKSYLGSFRVDYDIKRYWQWEGKSNKLNETDVEVLGQCLFHPATKSRRVTLFTPTRPSDFNFKRVR